MLRVVSFKLNLVETTDLRARTERLNKKYPCSFSETSRLTELRHSSEEMILLVARVDSLDDWLGWIPLWQEVMEQNRLRLVLIHQVPLKPILKMIPRQALREVHPDALADKALGFHTERQIEAFFQDAARVLGAAQETFFSKHPQLSKIEARTCQHALPEGVTWDVVFNGLNEKIRDLKEELNRSRRDLTSSVEANKLSSLLRLAENTDESEREKILGEILDSHPDLKNLIP